MDSFTISGSYPGYSLFFSSISDYRSNNEFPDSNEHYFHFSPYPDSVSEFILLMDHYSPPLDSINFYFLKRSINLYGEALVRTIAREKAGIGSTEKGIELVKDFFQSKGIEKSAVDIIDGSGLSPQNRVTTNSLTKALQYAKTRSWFSSFYHALPELNGTKMKSGSIGGVRSYAGYQKAANGKEYIFSIIVNNYSGSSSEMNKKLFRILDLLK
jgi:D-alanyl-D-alanine carboxypeptidase/D-alanyl-D-alanine-endopeptidase (penicillin-binding protein 4)